ncbi:MAG: undecaprenyl-phosphate glucose phosphotransferase [Lachnospiraceae bacterium]|nr:undecaprenyl-phosphate glucose phosphotransferase [Lachnospiraceae bacterium]MBR4209366.1 undecaprenyl-phosphate glucose phosphotransferase [Lachnospiraceae bacterium]
MIKDNQERLNQLHVLLDGLIIALSYALAYWVIFGLTGKLPAYDIAFYFNWLFLLVPLFLVLYWTSHLYSPKRVMGRRLELGNIVRANLIGLLILTMILYLGKEALQDFSRPLVFLFVGFNVVLESLFRMALRKVLHFFRARGYNQKHLLLVGYSKAAEMYIDRLLANPSWGFQIRGVLDDEKPWGYEYRGVHVIGRLDDLEPLLGINRLDEIAITLPLDHYQNLKRIVAACEKFGVHTQFIPDYYDIIPTKPYTEDLMGLAVVHIRHVPLSDSFYAVIKRIVDIFGALVAIVLFSPIMLIAVIGVKLSSPGPVIFKQERVGLHNRTFNMYKFRSMSLQNPKEEKKAWTVRNDPRVFPFGRFMRHTSIDELPQLFNILKGDMSLVGPRPERPLFVEKFREEIPRYMVKHQVRPGLTGWAQVNGYRGDTSIEKRIEYDLYYIENWTLGLDFKIIFLTFFKGFVNKNAY